MLKQCKKNSLNFSEKKFFDEEKLKDVINNSLKINA